MAKTGLAPTNLRILFPHQISARHLAALMLLEGIGVEPNVGKGIDKLRLAISLYAEGKPAFDADACFDQMMIARDLTDGSGSDLPSARTYRRKDIGLLRLFLPPELHTVFKAINKMEQGLRDLIAENSNEEFRGVYVESGLSATRKNILAPGSIGVYSGGSNYNPAQVMRDESVKALTEKIDKKLTGVSNKGVIEIGSKSSQFASHPCLVAQKDHLSAIY